MSILSNGPDASLGLETVEMTCTRMIWVPLAAASLISCSSSDDKDASGGDADADGDASGDADVSADADADAGVTGDADVSGDGDAPGDDADADGDPSARPLRDPTEVVLHFVLNMQDFSYVAESQSTLERMMDLHEDAEVPLDVYLTDQALADLEDNAPLLARVLDSSYVLLGYHIRPPKPYASSYDWADLAGAPPDERRATIREYETHLTSLTSGLPTERPGGLAALAALVGELPIPVGAGSSPELQLDVSTVFDALGADLFASHMHPTNLGARDANGFLLRPEHVDCAPIFLWEPVSARECFPEGVDDPVEILDGAIATACSHPAATPPCVVSVKVHDNDLFAVDSAWTTVYIQGRRRPPWDPTATASELLSPDEVERRWEFYEALVWRAAALAETVHSVSARELLEWIE